MRVCICLLVGLIPLVCHAEVAIHLKDGGRMIASEYQIKGSKLILKTQLGTIGIPKDRVARIEEGVEVHKPYPGQPGFGASENTKNSKAEKTATTDETLDRYHDLVRQMDISHGLKTEQVIQLITDLRQFRNNLLAKNSIAQYRKEFRHTQQMEQELQQILAARQN